ncbi:hypothetical protein F66182_5249 [Fusarium sp. NRRL 66182]|nr:hypothetical protein F66182_5249 [Fusarium sp. NRRL 66182]
MNPITADDAGQATPPLSSKRKRQTSQQSISLPSSQRLFQCAPDVASIPSDDDEEDDDDDDEEHKEYKDQITDQECKEPPAPPSDEVVTATEPILCREQQDLVDLIMTGSNVFFTGSAGCGKSTVLKAAVKRLRGMGLRVYIIAPTGRAALQVDGMTTWSYMGWNPSYDQKSLAELQPLGFRHQVRRRLVETDVLIIDEISMVESNHLERINECMKHVRCYADVLQGNTHNSPAFGGVQLIVTGDFCQLPPVLPFKNCYRCGAPESEMVRDEDEDDFICPAGHGPFNMTQKWAFKSLAWEEADFAHVHLKEIHRQSDQAFIQMLQKCRLGIPFTRHEVDTLMNHKCSVNNATRLLCTKDGVKQINEREFNKVPGRDMTHYRALDGFDWNRDHVQYEYHHAEENGFLKACRDHRFDPSVKLKTGALVMLQVNLDLERGLVNGSQGIVCGWQEFDRAKLPKAYKKNRDSSDGDTIGGDFARLRERQVRDFAEKQGVRHWPVVHFHNGTRRTIYPWCAVNALGSTEPYSLLYRTQIPLVHGWALSVHKSQGMTLDRVIVDLSRAFEEGQVYVALSRATSLDGLKINTRTGLDVGEGGNKQVREFLLDKFGDQLFQDHGGLTVGSSQQRQG